MVILSPYIGCDGTSIRFDDGLYLRCHGCLQRLCPPLNVSGYSGWMRQNIFYIEFAIFSSYINTMNYVNKAFPSDYIIRANVSTTKCNTFLSNFLMSAGITGLSL